MSRHAAWWTHSFEKSAPDLEDTSMHRLASRRKIFGCSRILSPRDSRYIADSSLIHRRFIAIRFTTHQERRSFGSVHLPSETWAGGKVQATENTTQAIQAKGNRADPASAWSYRLVRNAVFSVTGAFILVMGLFAWLQVFNTDNAANVTAALSSLFGIVGTLVGAYFGIKASGDAQDRSADTAQQAVRDQKDTSKDTVQKTVTVAADTAQKAAETAQTAKVIGPMATIGLATLIPVAGGASLLILRYYLQRMQTTA